MTTAASLSLGVIGLTAAFNSITGIISFWGGLTIMLAVMGMLTAINITLLLDEAAEKR